MRKQQYRLAGRLYHICAGMLGLFSVYMAVVVAVDIFQEKPSGDWVFQPNHANGYTIAADMNIEMFDTVVSYERHGLPGQCNDSGFIHIKNGTGGGYSKSKIDSILTDPSYKKNIIAIKRRVVSHESLNDNPGKIALANVPVTGHISIKPKDWKLATLLGVRNYADCLCIFFILFQLTRLFKKLKEDVSFDSSLSRAVWLIGNCLLVYQLLLFVTGIMVTHFIKYIYYSQNIVGTNFDNQFMQVRVINDVSLVTVFVGLALVVLSKLLDHGYELQQETDLTV